MYMMDVTSIGNAALSYIFLVLGFLRIWKIAVINRRISNFNSFKKDIEKKWGEEATR